MRLSRSDKNSGASLLKDNCVFDGVDTDGCIYVDRGCRLLGWRLVVLNFSGHECGQHARKHPVRQCGCPSAAPREPRLGCWPNDIAAQVFPHEDHLILVCADFLGADDAPACEPHPINESWKP